jgi:hypothetical protein
MEVFFKKSFIRDFKKLPLGVKDEVKEISTVIFPKINSFSELNNYSVERISGF